MELQAVILAAGKGSQMSDLTAHTPKPLLPVGNKPLIWHTMNMLEKYGFENVIIVALTTTANAIRQSIQTIPISFEIVPIKDDEDIDTLDALRHIKNYIKGDMLVLSCDLITDFEFHKLFDIYRLRNPTITMLLSSARAELETVPGLKVKKKVKNPREIVGITNVQDGSATVVLLENEADIERVLTNAEHIQVRTNLVDQHVYIIKKWVLDYIEYNGFNSSLRREFIPYVVRKQFAKVKRKQNDTEDAASEINQETSKDILTYLPTNKEFNEITKITLRGNANSWSTDCGFNHGLTCFAYIYEEGICFRVNNLSAYVDANRMIPKNWSSLVSSTATMIHPTVKKAEKTQIGSDSIVGENTSVGERVSIKRSVIGKNCVIESHVKIANCILYDNMKVGKGCHLQNSIICEAEEIEESCTIRDSFIRTQNSIPVKSNIVAESRLDHSNSMEFD